MDHLHLFTFTMISIAWVFVSREVRAINASNKYSCTKSISVKNQISYRKIIFQTIDQEIN